MQLKMSGHVQLHVLHKGSGLDLPLPPPRGWVCEPPGAPIQQGAQAHPDSTGLAPLSRVSQRGDLGPAEVLEEVTPIWLL